MLKAVFTSTRLHAWARDAMFSLHTAGMLWAKLKADTTTDLWCLDLLRCRFRHHACNVLSPTLILTTFHLHSHTVHRTTRRRHPHQLDFASQYHQRHLFHQHDFEGSTSSCRHKPLKGRPQDHLHYSRVVIAADFQPYRLKTPRFSKITSSSKLVLCFDEQPRYLHGDGITTSQISC